LPGPRKILTVHSPLVPSTVDALLTGIEEALTRSGASRVWIDATWSPDLAVMADFAVPHVRPAAGELAGASADAAEVVSVPRPR